MMRFRSAARAAILAAAVYAGAVCAQSGQVTIVKHEGAEIHLQDDGTWSFAKPAVIRSNADGESYINLRDGRILKLKSDFTYEFTKSQPKAATDRSYPAISVGSSAVGTDANQVTQKALEEVYASAAAQLRSFIPSRANRTRAMAYLTACVKDEVKNHEVVQTTKQNGNQWEVEMKIELPETRSQKIIECLEYQLQ